MTFDQVNVFFFPRCQGFTSVPRSRRMHSGHDAAPQRAPHVHACRVRRGAAAPTTGKVPQQTQGGKAGSSQVKGEKKLPSKCIRSFVKKKQIQCNNYSFDAFRSLQLTKNGTEENEEAERLTVEDIPEQDIDISGTNLDEGSFLQPYAPKRRYALLKTGRREEDRQRGEERQLHELRISRENCGCDCQGFCEPETCSCSLAGIKCQVRDEKTCSTIRAPNHNTTGTSYLYYTSNLTTSFLPPSDGSFLFPVWLHQGRLRKTQKGRIEFNSTRVQTHYIHTIMKLELEKRLEEQSSTEEEEENATTPIQQCPPSPLVRNWRQLERTAAAAI